MKMIRFAAAALLCLSLTAAPALSQSRYNPGGIPAYDATSDATRSLEVPAALPVLAQSSGTGNAIQTATLAGVAGKTTVITGFQCTSAGATAALVVTVVVSGLLGGNQNYTYVFPAGVSTPGYGLFVQWATPLVASAVSTAIVVTMPAGGAGNVGANCAAQGFYQ
jgi:hypothetical protein